VVWGGGGVGAIAAAGPSGQVTVVGFDAQDEAQRAVQAGRMAATVAQNPRDMGRLAIISAARLLAGETLPAEQPVAISLVR